MYENSAIITVAVPPNLKAHIRRRAFEENKTVSSFLREQLESLFLPAMVANPTEPSDNHRPAPS